MENARKFIMKQSVVRLLGGVLGAAWLAAGADMARAGVKEWKTGAVGSWHEPTNWVQEAAPVAGDTVFITNAGAVVTLAAATPELAAATISRTLVFTNWATQLHATSITLKPGALLKMPGAFDDTQMSNRIHIVCHDFTMEQGSTINADYCGYAKNAGPSKGGVNVNYSAGGGHAGRGGDSSYAFGGASRGSLEAPELPGSGGGVRAADIGKASSEGGGVVRIEATDAVTINGMISANGRSGVWACGGGAGGSVFISCDTFTGQALGNLLVKGGDGEGTAYSGGGSGGRVAILYTQASFADGFALNGTPGSGFGNEAAGQFFCKAARGTVYLPDATILDETLDNNLFTQVDLHIPSLNYWAIDRLSVKNCSVFLAQDGIKLDVAGDLTIGDKGHLGLGSFCGDGVVSLICGGNLYVTNSGALSVFAGLTNGVDSYGALVDVAGDMTVANTGWVYPYCHTNTGAAVKFNMENLWIRHAVSGVTAQGFNARGKGFGAVRGPGAGGSLVGGYNAGGGYGGKGGDAGIGGLIKGGLPYGYAHAPMQSGSGGGGARGGYGGGLIWIEAQRSVLCNGELNASGATGSDWAAGGGSGGGIFISGQTFVGDGNALLAAYGAKPSNDWGAGGGGGGRIAVWHGRPMPEALSNALLAGQLPNKSLFVVTPTLSSFGGAVAVAQGDYYRGTPAEPGTAVFLKYEQAATVLQLR